MQRIGERKKRADVQQGFLLTKCHSTAEYLVPFVVNLVRSLAENGAKPVFLWCFLSRQYFLRPRCLASIAVTSEFRIVNDHSPLDAWKKTRHETMLSKGANCSASSARCRFSTCVFVQAITQAFRSANFSLHYTTSRLPNEVNVCSLTPKLVDLAREAPDS